ncbi:hypothetical protein [Pedobacter alluvionis]|uniref:Uncharacterized protein n=1 Tax=Pedobacter alluvionis TaxID=475253 RepID=A0A497XUR4_9SPHI|nr:hypothetical protein [Pedobacter alluvionis]RLJ73463.1 hypothetical protein BCL90_3620 [Pedobacter alluvionis]TFB32899.1 hypothetical protein E3V97_02335 [Pedobacter alluvionis]
MVNTWEVLKHGERLIAAIETPPTVRDLSFNNRITPAFDMLFVQSPNGNYILIIYMRIKIIYTDRTNQYWTFIDKDTFEKNFRFSLNRAAIFTYNHWTLNVVKLRKGEWAQSYVTSSLRTGDFDNNDFDYVKKVLEPIKEELFMSLAICWA